MTRTPRLVVLAASAGGIPALLHILARLPRDFPAAVAIVQHRAPTLPSILPQLLARRCALPVEEVTTPGTPIRAGHVYVAPADRHLVVTPDVQFALADGQRVRHVRSSANPLMETAADVLGADVAAVVLTGGDSDATDGVQSVKAQGGRVLAQDPATAQVSSMPLSAIATGAVDEILPLDAIAPAIVRWAQETAKAEAS